MSTYLDLFITFFKIGMVSFGGGYAMISIIQQQVVMKDWLTVAEYAKIVIIAQMVPGPIAVNTATYVGASVCSGSMASPFLGALFAVSGVALPSFTIMLLLASSLAKFSQAKQLNWLMGGIRPIVIGIMFAAVLFFGKLAFLKVQNVNLLAIDFTQVLQVINPIGILIGIVAFVLHYRFSVSAIKIILITGIAGFCFI